TLTSPLFPYTTLFRSPCRAGRFGVSGIGREGNHLTYDTQNWLVYTNYEILSSKYVDFERLQIKSKIAHEIHERGENALRHPPDRSEEHTSELQSRFDL